MIDRRSFFRSTVGAIFAAALAPLSSTYVSSQVVSLCLQDVDDILKKHFMPFIEAEMNRPNALYEMMKDD